MEICRRWRGRPKERVGALRKLEGMGPRPPVLGLTAGEKWAVSSVSIRAKKEGARYYENGFTDLALSMSRLAW